MVFPCTTVWGVNMQWVMLLPALTILQGICVHGRTRAALKGGVFVNSPIVVNDSSAVAVQKLVESAKEGSVIELNFESIVLKRALSPRKNITIKGSSSSLQTKIGCLGDEPAFLIQNGHVTVRNIIIEGCQGGAVVVDSVESKKKMIASFIEVKFFDNGKRGQGMGGALRINGVSNVKVQDCHFNRNMAQRGGAIFGNDSSVTVKTSAFYNNVAALGGGAIYMQDPSAVQFVGRMGAVVSSNSLAVVSSIFSDNKVTESVEDLAGLQNLLGGPMERMQFLLLQHPSTTGGSIFATGLNLVSVKSSYFNSNKARGGGAISLGDNARNILMDTHFCGNIAIGVHGNSTVREQELLQQSSSSQAGRDMQGIHGGAVYAASTITYILLISNCSFINNHAAFGGGLHIVGPEYTGLLIEKSWFEGNMASSAAGGILVRNTLDFQLRDTIVTNNVGKSGGGLLVTNGAELLVSNTQFTGNWAVDGGGMMGIGAGVVVMDQTLFSGNEATHTGGGASFMESVARAPVAVQGSRFVGNYAAKGGALYMNGIPEVDIRGETTFSRNTALSGAGLLMIARNRVKNQASITKSSFTGNLADKHACENRSMRWGNACMKLEEEDIENSCGFGGGGALCFVLNQLPKRAPAVVQVVQVNFSGNAAMTGGDISMVTKGDQWQQRCKVSEPFQPAFASCRTIQILNPIFEFDNEESLNGVFATDESAVYIAQNVSLFGAPNLTRLDHFRANMSAQLSR